MTKAEQPKVSPSKPGKPVSRLAELAATKIVTAGEAFEHDLVGGNQRDPVQGIPRSEVSLPLPATAAPKKVRVSPNLALKRTFRYPRGLDSELKKFVHRYNLEKREDEPELTMEEVGVLMAKSFMASEPAKIVKDSRGL